MCGLGEANIQFYAGNLERHLPRTGITEATRSQRNIDLVRLLLDIAMIEGLVIFIIEIDGDCSASALAGSWSIDSDQRHPGTVFQLRQIT